MHPNKNASAVEHAIIKDRAVIFPPVLNCNGSRAVPYPSVNADFPDVTCSVPEVLPANRKLRRRFSADKTETYDRVFTVSEAVRDKASLRRRDKPSTQTPRQTMSIARCW